MLFASTIILVSNFSYAQGNENTISIPKDGNIYLNPELGNDASIGTKESPLKTLFEAASRVNQANGKGAITIYLSDGIYGLDASAFAGCSSPANLSCH